MALTRSQSARWAMGIVVIGVVAMAGGSDLARLVLATPTAHADSSPEVIWRRDGQPFGLTSPTGLALDAAGNAYIVDAGHNRVQRWTPDGAHVTHWGAYGPGAGQFVFNAPQAFVSMGDPDSASTPWGSVAASDDGLVYVVDPVAARVQVFDNGGRFKHAWDARGAADLPRSRPVGIAVDPLGRVLVVDSAHHRMLVFDRHGRLLQQWGQRGSEAGAFDWPAAVAVDSKGQVFVADGLNARIQKFDSDGGFLTAWSAAGDPATRADFGMSMALAVDGQGRVYVADGSHDRIQVFDGDGGFLGQLSILVGGRRLGYIGGIAVDHRGDVYITDTAAGAVIKLRPRGRWPMVSLATPFSLPAATIAPPPVMTPTDR